MPLIDSQNTPIIDPTIDMSNPNALPLGAWVVIRSAGSFIAGNWGHQDTNGTSGYVSYTVAATLNCPIASVTNVKGANGYEDEVQDQAADMAQIGKAGEDLYCWSGSSVFADAIFAESTTTTAADLYIVSYTPGSICGVCGADATCNSVPGDVSCGCAAGSYGAASVGAPPNCASCPAGDYCPDNAVTPVTCPAGSYCPAGSAAPIACDAGYTSSDGASSCTPIDLCAVNNGGCGDPNYYSCTNNIGAAPTCAAIDLCATNNGGCDPTATCTNTSGAVSCACNAGSAGNGSSCSMCPAGTYSSVSGATTCTACPAGTASSLLGATSAATCFPCAAGSYSASSGAATCVACPAGYAPTADATGCLPFVSAAIDLAAGGTLSAVSGTPLAGASLTIAPGSGTGTTTFSLGQPASVPLAAPPNALGPVVQVLPSGLSLAVAASLTLPWSGSGVTPGVARLDDTSVGWVEVAPASYDASTVTVLTTGFSYWVVIDPAGLPDCTNATCSTTLPTFTTPLGASSSSWVCIDYPVADNTACTGGNACMRNEACQAGVCTGGSTCAANATCTATGCACNAGFAGDGFTCGVPAVTPSLSFAEGTGITTANQNYFARFVVTTVDQSDNVIYDPSALVTATAVTASTSWPVTIVDNGDGTYACQYLPTKAENVVLTIAVNGVEISNSPAKWSQDVIVKNSAYAPNCALASVQNVAAGEPQAWGFSMNDENLNPVLDFHDRFVLTVTNGYPLAGGLFSQAYPGIGTFAFTGPIAGEAQIVVTVDNDVDSLDSLPMNGTPVNITFS